MKNIFIVLILFFTTNSYGQLEKTFKSTKWNYTIQYPKEYAKSTNTSQDNAMTELHLADGNGRSIIIMSQPFSSADATDLDKLTKEELQSMLRKSYPICNVSKFYKTTIGGRKGTVSYYSVTSGKTTIKTIQAGIYNGQCLINIIITTFPETFQNEENNLLKIINSIKFN